jgi:hypothetical protein
MYRLTLTVSAAAFPENSAILLFVIHGSFERVEELNNTRTNLTNQNSIQEEIKSRLKSAMLSIIQCKIFYLPICYPKISR